MQDRIFQTDPERGLTLEQVQKRITSGRKNTPPEKITKSVSKIMYDNICTLFNLFNVLIAIALALVSAWSNMFFILIIALNTVIGIVQELKAKKLVDELSLLSMPHAEVVRQGKRQSIALEDLVQDDLLLLESGQQVCADSMVLGGKVEVNESLLTGEADPIPKQEGDSLLSGSFIVSGKCRVQVQHVGNENYATKLTQQAKKLKAVNSELMASMKKVTKFTGYLIIPLGVLLFLQAFFLRGDVMFDAVVSTSAGLLGMLPKGLVLLISICLAVGVTRLAKKRVLVQELFALETLAHVDTLCLDKTGTITEGKMRVEKAIDLGSGSQEEFDRLMGSFLACSDDSNATFEALREFFKKAEKPFKATGKVPFSSQRKWSAVTFENGQTLVVGAPERLIGGQPAQAAKELSEGKRVLLAGLTCEKVDANLGLVGIKPMRAIVISDPVRQNAKQTLEYFRKEGVEIKVISGDNPETVAAVAKRAGLKGAEKYIDMSEVTTKEELCRAAFAYTVFGRVSPTQKKELVRVLQRRGRSVAMTGDGVNDILALREADCSIAIAEGSDAARQVAQLVLLDSDFGSLPHVMAEGRRVVNNVTRVSGVFFVKTIYSVLLSIVCLLLNAPFPFLPIQITLIDLAIEGYPSFFMSFEPDGRRIKGRFLPTALSNAAPNAIAIVAGVLLASFLAPLVGISADQVSSVMYLLVGTVGVFAVFKACVPFNALRIFLFTSMTVGYYAAIAIFHKLLQFTMPSASALGLFAALAVVCLLIERLTALMIRKTFGKRACGKAKLKPKA